MKKFKGLKNPAKASLLSAVHYFLSAFHLQALDHHKINVAFETMKMRFKDLNTQNQSGKEQFTPTDTSHATWLRRCALEAEDNYRLATERHVQKPLRPPSPAAQELQELPPRFAGEKRARAAGTERWISPRGRPWRKLTTISEGHVVKLLNTTTTRSANTA